MTPPPSIRGLTARLSLFYAAYFAVVGIQLPFWPVWLAAQGLGDREISILLSSVLWVRVIANPLVGHHADQRAERRRPMFWLAAAAAVAFALFAWPGGFIWFLIVGIAYGGLVAPVHALGESLTVLCRDLQRFDYGRVRLWGSLAFIVAATAGGRVLQGHSASLIYWVMLTLLVALTAVVSMLPDLRPRRRHSGRGVPLRQTLALPGFALFLAAAALIQASHAMYYSFGTLHWTRAGHSEGTVGVLWGLAVMSEVVLFLAAPVFSSRWAPAAWIVIGGAAALVRWSVTAVSTELTVLWLVQPLHAFSFGATHLGAIGYIGRVVPPHLSATAQSLYAGLAMGGVMGLSILASGPMFVAFGGLAFWAMAAVAAVGAAMGMVLWRRTRRPAGGTPATGTVDSAH